MFKINLASNKANVLSPIVGTSIITTDVPATLTGDEGEEYFAEVTPEMKKVYSEIIDYLLKIFNQGSLSFCLAAGPNDFYKYDIKYFNSALTALESNPLTPIARSTDVFSDEQPTFGLIPSTYDDKLSIDIVSLADK
jgi:hypothetical protein